MKKPKEISPKDTEFPLSVHSFVRGSRRLAREKVLQILAACESDDISWRQVFQHIFFREFTFDSKEAENPKKLLTPEEVHELDADVPIRWEAEEIEYAQHILKEAESKREHNDAIIERLAANWQFDRIALIDRQLLRIAFAELTTCSEIPLKVTINEVVELSKRYSTDKSNIFINGVLDSAIEEFRSEGLIQKTGRGLIDS